VEVVPEDTEAVGVTVTSAEEGPVPAEFVAVTAQL
jgi:hypothetical protein